MIHLVKIRLVAHVDLLRNRKMIRLKTLRRKDHLNM